jgi:hypothetical protein
MFSARIQRDGSVRFSDRVVGRKHPRHDRETNSSEKRWFLEQTEVLRQGLTDSARAESRMRTRRSLEHELERIVAQTHLEVAEVHRRILTLWLECGADEDTERARPIIETFVRVHLPQTSPRAFTEAELEAFRRVHSEVPAFSPYPSLEKAEATGT